MTTIQDSRIQHMFVRRGKAEDHTFHALFYRKVYLDDSLIVYGYYYGYDSPDDNSAENFRLELKADMTEILSMRAGCDMPGDTPSEYRVISPSDGENGFFSEFDNSELLEICDEMNKWLTEVNDEDGYYDHSELIPELCDFIPTPVTGQFLCKSEGAAPYLCLFILRQLGACGIRFTKKKEFDDHDAPPFPPLLKYVREESVIA